MKNNNMIQWLLLNIQWTAFQLYSGWKQTKQYINTIENWGRDGAKQGKDIWLPLEMYGELERDEEYSLLYRLQYSYCFLNLQEVFIMKVE